MTGAKDILEDIYPLSSMQQGLLFHTALAPESGVYVQQLSCGLAGPLNPSALKQAWQQVISRHTALRTAFIWKRRSEPVQVVYRKIGLCWEEHDFRETPSSEQAARIAEFLNADRAQGFDLSKPPLMRFTLIRLGERDYKFVWTYHHILMDGWCGPLLMKEVFACYEAYNSGKEAELEYSPPYGNYISWLSKQDLTGAEKFWRKTLRGFVSPTPLPGGKNQVATFGGAADYSCQEITLSESAKAGLESLARRRQVTLNTITQTAWAILLGRYSGEDDVVFGATVSGRPPDLPGVAKMIGLFINTLPVRVQLQQDRPIIDSMREVQDRQVEMRQFEHSPLVQVQGWSDVTRGRPLFDAILVFENYPVSEQLDGQEADIKIEDISLVERTNYPITLEAIPGERFVIRALYDTTRFDDEVMRRMLTHFQTLLVNIAADPDQHLCDLSLLSDSERSLIVHEWNETGREYETSLCIHELIERQAQLSPDHVAVSYLDDRLTYRQLNERANQLAHYLIERGAGPDRLVGICQCRSLEMVVSLLAVLKSGAAYVPVDPTYPEARVEYMLSDSRAEVVLVGGSERALVSGYGGEVVEVEAEEEEISRRSKADPGVEVRGENLAYVIYTSGSTGLPKGAMNTHAGMRNRLLWMQETYHLTSEDRVLQKTPFSFDVSVWEFFWPLITGARLVVARPEGHKDSAYLASLIEEERITTLHFVPSMLEAFLLEAGVERCRSLKRVICSGEALRSELQKRFFSLMKADLHNLYGPTEASIDVTYWECRRDNTDEVPIGKPIANTQVYVLDNRMEPVPIGVPGELYLGGAGLGRGYWNRAALTSEKWVPNAFSETGGQRLYRTGDLVKYRADGNIEYLGRIDHQVKVRGFRIELGEIEAELSRHPDVREVVVLLREDVPGDKRLAAYIVPDRGQQPRISELRDYLKETLPDHMVPSFFMMLDAMPLSPNGKLDRQALPAPDGSRPELEQRYVPPRNAIEEALVAIWASVLGVEAVGIHDNFFALGGDSIRSLQLRVRAEQRGLSFTLQELFQHQTVAELAQQLKVGVKEGGGGAKVGEFEMVSEGDRLRMGEGVEDAYPLAMLQAGMLFHSEFASDTATYHDVFTYHLKAELDSEALKESIQELGRRHAILRTSFEMTGYSEPMQMVHKEVEIGVGVEDISHLRHDEQERFIADWIEVERNKHFDWRQAPLLSFMIYRRGADAFQLAVSFHHAILDGWSVAVMLTELFWIYRAKKGEQVEPIQEAPRSRYRELVWLEREAKRSEQTQKYWEEKLSQATVSRLPRWESLQGHASDGSGSSAGETEDGLLVRRIKVTIAPEVSGGLKKLANKIAVPLKSVLLAAHLRVMSLLGGTDDVLTGMVSNGRPEQEDADRALGLYLNTLPLRVKLDGGSWEELAQAAFEAEMELLPQRWYPLASIQKLMGNQTLFESSFNFNHFHIYEGIKDVGGVEVLGSLTFEQTNFMLSADFVLNLTNSNINLQLSCDARALSQQQAEAIGEYYAKALQSMVNDPTARYEVQDPLSDIEKRHLIEWNETGKEYETSLCIHELIERQAQLSPDHVAISYLDRQLTYRQLNERANQLAHYLIERGAGPDKLVAICQSRSLEMVVSLLAVLKSGAAYVPVDPTYPEARVEYMLSDSRAEVVLVGRSERGLVSGYGGEVVDVEAEAEEISRRSKGDLRVEVRGENLAYVIYTSGSTGLPKGVMISHRNVLNFFTAMDERVGDWPGGTWLAVTSISFDISVLELLWTLARGFKVVVQREQSEAVLSTPNPLKHANKPIDFSLFYFASDERDSDKDRFKLLLEGARFGDTHGFSAVWTPERHFHVFGGLYPNPSVTGAGVATITERINIRAGSVVLPLHNPIRVAEEWSVVDNLSGGRVGLSFASGWHADDFVLAPENYTRRKDVMIEQVEKVRKLWRGEAVKFLGGAGNEVDIRILPRPVQQELPIWITAAGSPETFQIAGELGAGLLTHLLGQTVEELSEKVELYRDSWRKHGHGPGNGHVVLMLHAFVGTDTDVVREKVREPFTNYLASSISLIKNLAKSFGQNVDSNDFTREDMQALLAHAFDRYFETSGLMGTPETCLRMVDRLKGVGIDEVACLIDFGVDFDSVMESLEYLDIVRRRSNERGESVDDYSIAAQIRSAEVTHLQCTPSLARMLTLEQSSSSALASLKKMLVGGEALPARLAVELKNILKGDLQNMYGPTEATVWCAVHDVDEVSTTVPIGRPIANTQAYILDRHFMPVPIGVTGDLYIGGEQIVRGYLNKPDLAADRFIPNPFAAKPGERMYKTGDLARYQPDGVIEFMGRSDDQVKIRGHRIEIGEVETVLGRHPAIREAVVVANDDGSEDKRLVAYVVPERASQPSASELLSYLKKQLPEYMLPSVFVPLDAMPMTANGKVNRKMLPKPDRVMLEQGRVFAPPRNAIEEALVAIWASVLGVEAVGIHDNFFALGGDSIRSLQLRVRAEQRGLSFTLQELFQHQTVAELARQLKVGVKEGGGGAKVGEFAMVSEGDRQRMGEGVEDAYPLAMLQAGMLFHSEFDSEADPYHDVFSFHLKAELDSEALKESIQELGRRHAILRTSFEMTGYSEPMQMVHKEVEIGVGVEDISHLTDDEQERFIADWVGVQKGKTFDYGRAALLYFQIHIRSADTFQLTVGLHHAILDGWSVAVMLTELFWIYRAKKGEQVEPIQEAPRSRYRELVWLEREAKRSGESERYWEEKLSQATVSRLPRWETDAYGEYDGDALSIASDQLHPSVYLYKVPIDRAVSEGLRLLSRRLAVPLKSVLLAAHLRVMSLLGGTDDVITGLVINSRPEQEDADRALGLYLNTLPLRVKLDGGSWEELAQEAFEAEMELLPQRWYPLASIQKLMGNQTLFETGFNFNHFHIYEGIKDVRGVEVISGQEYNQTNFALGADFVLDLANSQIHLQLSCDARIMPESQINVIGGYYENALRLMANDPSDRYEWASVLSEKERHQLLVEWNETGREYETSLCIHELIERQAQLSPDHVAVSYLDDRLTYRQLNERANQLAHYLIERGAGPDRLVGICQSRSLEMVVSLLAVLKSGAAYVPVDPTYPEARVEYMLSDSRAEVVLVGGSERALVSGYGGEVVEVEAEAEEISRRSKGDLRVEVRGENLAYVIYTSGSTGLPKGVMISHREVLNTLRWRQEYFRLNPSDKILQNISFAFDPSVWQIFGALITGASLVLLDAEYQQDIVYQLKLIKQHQITIVDFPPSMLRVFLEYYEPNGNNSLKHVFCGGAVLPPELQELYFKRVNGNLYNVYGPTEIAIDATFWACSPQDIRATVPIGHPIANKHVYIADSHLQPVPVGVAGELCIGGAGLARGYINSPAITAEKFIPDPFSNEPGARMYRTGDFARHLADSAIEFLGRNDEQVKVRGYRIELSEIENVLCQNRDIREAAVLARENSAGNSSLTAYVVSELREAISADELQRYLRERLPEYMIPSAIVTLDRLPLMPNGKVDRRALPAPDLDARADSDSYQPARSRVEQELVAIWQQVLRTHRVGIHDNFFALGGDSIISIQVTARANQAGIKISPRQVFEHRTIAELAAVAGTSQAVAAEQGIISGPVALTPIQHWLLEQKLADLHHWNQAVMLESATEIDVDAMRRAVKVLLGHHDALRLRVKLDASDYRQEIASQEENDVVTFIDLSQGEAVEEAANRLQASLDLERGPIMRVAVMKIGAGEAYRVLIVIHHLAVDGVSWRILLEDLVGLYESEKAGKQGRLGAKTTSFKEWAERLEEYAYSQGVKEETGYWEEQGRRERKKLRVDEEGEEKSNEVKDARMVNREMSGEETSKLLREVGQAYKARVNEVLLSGLVEGLRGWSGQGQVLVEVEGHGREQDVIAGVDLTRTVGWFTTTYPLLLDAQDSNDVGETLRYIKEQVRGVPGGGMGYGVLKYLSKDEEVKRVMESLPEAEISFNYLGQLDNVIEEEASFRLARESAGPLRSKYSRRKHLLEINASVLNGKLRLSLIYSENIHRQETIEKLADAIMAALRWLITHHESHAQRSYTPSDFPLVRLSRHELDTVIKANRHLEDIYPLSSTEQEMASWSIRNPGAGVYFNQLDCRLDGEIDEQAFRSGWDRVVQRHSALRKCIIQDGLSEPLQVILRDVGLTFNSFDWRDLGRQEQQDMLGAFLKADRESGLDLSKAPLMRFTLIRLEEDSYEFIWSHHQVLLDGWSMPIILKEVFDTYRAIREGRDTQLKQPFPYGSYLAWAGKQDFTEADAFWKQAFDGVSSPTLLSGKGMQESSAAHRDYEQQHIRLSEAVTAKLRAVSVKYQVTLNSIVQCAWALLLNDLCGGQDVIFGATMSGRTAPLAEIETAIGLFINTLPVRVRVRPEMSLAALLKELQAHQAEARQHEQSPLARSQGWHRFAPKLPLFDTVIQFENYPVDQSLRSRTGELSIREVNALEQLHYPLTLQVVPGSSTLLKALYYGDHFDAATVNNLLTEMQAALENIAANPERRVGDLLRFINPDDGAATLEEIIGSKAGSGSD